MTDKNREFTPQQGHEAGGSGQPDREGRPDRDDMESGRPVQLGQETERKPGQQPGQGQPGQGQPGQPWQPGQQGKPGQPGQHGQPGQPGQQEGGKAPQEGQRTK